MSDTLCPLPFKKWELLAETLKKNWPDYVHVYYFVQTVRKWKSKEPNLPITIYCPNGDQDSGIFIAISSYSIYELIIFALKGFEETLYKVVTETQVIDWSRRIYIAGISSQLLPTVCSIIDTLKQKKRLQMTIYPSNCSFKSKEECAAVEIVVPDGCYLKNVDESHVPLIHSLWPHRDIKRPDLSTKYVHTMLKFNGGIGLFSKDNDELLSWALQSDLGALSLVQTIDRCKKRGYAKVVVNAFAKELALRGVDSFIFILEGNHISDTMFKSLNWKEIFPTNWVMLEQLKS